MKIHIDKDFCSNEVKVYAFEEKGDFRNFFYMDNGKLIGIENRNNYIDSEQIKPLVVLPILFYQAFEAALIQEANNQSRKTENHHKLEGTLAATTKHLDDLRVIVFSKYDDRPEIQKYKNKE